MRAGGASGAAAEAKFLAAVYGVALLYFDLGQMEVQGEKSLAVVNDDAVAFEIQEAGKQDRACIHGGDGSAGGAAEIETVVRALGLAVEDSLRAVDVGDG